MNFLLSFLQELGKLEDNIFIRRKQKEEGMNRARARRENEQKDKDDREVVEKKAKKDADKARRVIAVSCVVMGMSSSEKE